MTKGELRQALDALDTQGYGDDVEMLVATDPEGNGFYPLTSLAMGESNGWGEFNEFDDAGCVDSGDNDYAICLFP